MKLGPSDVVCRHFRAVSSPHLVSETDACDSLAGDATTLPSTGRQAVPSLEDACHALRYAWVWGNVPQCAYTGGIHASVGYSSWNVIVGVMSVHTRKCIDRTGQLCFGPAVWKSDN
ncbi:hypothetical protein BaRGS_00006348 [Batillaria attramentaria]|uniref:Uncharacterized protein n=1 Tax=Batillaria attramentaria TaxID=370345 RepID=A0ABD0LSX8_9CAEN